MESQMTKKEVQSIWQEHRSYIVNVFGFFGFTSLFLFWAPMYFFYFWHYIICLFLLTASYVLKKLGKQKAVAGIAVLVVFIALAGFFLVYQGQYVDRGWTFYKYITRDCFSSLPIFLFPCIAIWFALWKPKHNIGRTDP